jgi:hypothetical protein
MVRREKANCDSVGVHALDVLEQFSNVDEMVSRTEQAFEAAEITCFAYRHPQARGYIEQNKSSENYRLGLKCLQISQTYIHQMGLLMQSRSILESWRIDKGKRLCHPQGWFRYAARFCRATARGAGSVVLGYGVAGSLHGGG